MINNVIKIQPNQLCLASLLDYTEINNGSQPTITHIRGQLFIRLYNIKKNWWYGLLIELVNKNYRMPLWNKSEIDRLTNKQKEMKGLLTELAIDDVMDDISMHQWGHFILEINSQRSSILLDEFSLTML